MNQFKFLRIVLCFFEVSDMIVVIICLTSIINFKLYLMILIIVTFILMLGLLAFYLKTLSKLEASLLN